MKITIDFFLLVFLIVLPSVLIIIEVFRFRNIRAERIKKGNYGHPDEPMMAVHNKKEGYIHIMYTPYKNEKPRIRTFKGSGTVWKELPFMKRCPTSQEIFLTEIAAYVEENGNPWPSAHRTESVKCEKECPRYFYCLCKNEPVLKKANEN